MNSGVCSRCGKRLTDRKSIAAGMGYICRRKLTGSIDSKDQQEWMKDKYLPYDGGDIVLSRDNNGTKTVNVQQKMIVHSPTGFEWGYNGSGCADLALNILFNFVSAERALEIYQEFKEQFVSRVPEKGGEIKKKDIEDWIFAKNQDRTGDSL
ncbi:MAG: DUF6011 domain-containing protein [Bacteroidales bacterium]|jgi:hypothetical protein|nr:DUF6011 domain-containing protein [Bacteroidales bacterium]